MTVSTYRPATQNENGGLIIRTSNALWDLYKEANRILNFSTVIISNGEIADQALLPAWLANTNNIPNWEALAVNYGMPLDANNKPSAEHAAALFLDMARAFGQINAEHVYELVGETYVEQPNYLRLFMHRVG